MVNKELKINDLNKINGGERQVKTTKWCYTCNCVPETETKTKTVYGYRTKQQVTYEVCKVCGNEVSTKTESWDF